MFIIVNLQQDYQNRKILTDMIDAGTDVFRLNLSYGTKEDTFKKVKMIRKVASQTGKKIKIIADLPGNKIRLGKIHGITRSITKDQKVVFRSAVQSDDDSFVPVDFSFLAEYVRKGDVLTYKDGELGFLVMKINKNGDVLTKALNTFEIVSDRGLNLSRAVDKLDHLTNQNVMQMEAVSEVKPEMVAFSFVNSAQQLEEFKEKLFSFNNDKNWKPVIVAKIESPLGVKNITEIATKCDMVMVARGDLGLQCDFRKLGLYQKEIIQKTKAEGKGVIVATQILNSMLYNFMPSRADVLDLTNIILDGADGIMITDSSLAENPARRVKVAREIIDEVEKAIKK